MTARSPERQYELRRRWFVAGSVLFIAAMLASSAHDLWRSQREAEQRAGQEISVLARVLAEQTRRSLQTVDVMLLGIASDKERGELGHMNAAQLSDYLRRSRAEVSDVSRVFMTDAEGHVVGESNEMPGAPGNIGQRPAFQRLKTGTATIIDGVAGMPGGGGWQLPILHRIDGVDGRFAGAVAALLDAGYFERFYGAVQLDNSNVIALHGDDGALLVRHPVHESAIGQILPTWAPALAPMGAETKPRRFVSVLDGVERLGVAQPVPGYNLHVVVTRDMQRVLQPWRESAASNIVRTLLLCAAAIGLMAVVLRQLKGIEQARASIARSEHALRVSEERYALAVAGANEGLWDWDLRTDQVFFSERAQELCGFALGAPLRERRAWIGQLRHHPDDVQRVRDALVDHLRGRSPHFDVEMRLPRPGGGMRPDEPDDWNWVRQRGLLVRDEHGALRRMAGSIEDITARKRAEAQREALEVRLRTAQKLEAMGTLSGGIAHDFNNILGAILGYAELAHGHAPAGSALAEQLDGVMSAGLRAKSLVQRILAFSRSGLGEKVPVHVQSVVDEALGLLEASLPAGVRLEHDLRAGDAALVGDAAQIHQVVMNLGMNAVQASPSPGVVSVRLAARTLEKRQHFTSGELPAGQYLELTVADQGSGVQPGQIERIFDPFFTTKDVGVGTGLGLSLVHGIVTELQGAIDVRTEPGQGSTFTVLLPWGGEGAPDPRRARQDTALPRGNGERIMVVDDEPPLVALAEETLAALGYEPVGFTSSVDARRAFEDAPREFDALLSDEAMPQLTGSELVAAIRRLRPELPVLLMTGYLSPAIAARAQALGIQEVLAKPLVARDIARALARAVPAR